MNRYTNEFISKVQCVLRYWTIKHFLQKNGLIVFRQKSQPIVMVPVIKPPQNVMWSTLENNYGCIWGQWGGSGERLSGPSLCASSLVQPPASTEQSHFHGPLSRALNPQLHGCHTMVDPVLQPPSYEEQDGISKETNPYYVHLYLCDGQ